ncbi:MarR family winged helix-turn-helix transcriptional regulator [Glycomyces algeriensis]|uniref:MarR family transcriptional regulator n=1 Tax=Glycomyces algeriensis TaxID=256037 RepID=A0A9W6GCJ5_9ACTN|nr:MarR family transcriptional regulator [Glycomyces algeriensis]MDA1368371.1 MarR family transcriptional regulator [Glycomyces algeriensis]MDR7351814.1 DNA-binding MarR family transcriptional regulator [Glycomyces algeriensis]GLI44541.1 MarR family transcriptional regulator [Glycomyces algeriensis]
MEENTGASMGMGTALVRTAFLVDTVYSDSVRQFDLTVQQAQLLCVLIQRPFGMFELAKTLGLAKSSISGLVDRCEKRGLVRREADPGDGRAFRVALTEQGAQLAEEFHDETTKRVADLPLGLSAAEQEVLAGLLTRVVADNHVPVVFTDSGCPTAKDCTES